MYYAFTADLESAIREEFGVLPAKECRVWYRFMTHVHTYKLLSKAERSRSLQDAALYNGQVSSHQHFMQFPCL